MTTAPGRAPAVAEAWRHVATGDDAVAVAERHALGTSARVAVWPPENLARARAAVDEVLTALDRQASRFRPDSEICWLHRARFSGGHTATRALVPSASRSATAMTSSPVATCRHGAVTAGARSGAVVISCPGRPGRAGHA